MNNVVRMCISGIGRRATHIPGEHFAECAPFSVGRRGEDVSAEVAGEQAGGDVDDAGDQPHPCGFKVKIAAPAILVGHHVVVAGGNGVSGCGYGDFEKWLRAGVTGFPPIEAGVRDYDFAAGDKQREERNYGDPMGDADQSGVPLSRLNF